MNTNPSGYRKLLLYFCLLIIPAFTHFPATAAGHAVTDDTVNDGYSALRLFLQDEQYLTVVRRVKMVITFKNISDDTSKLIDEIADSSEQALQELEMLAQKKPVIVFGEFSDDWIGKATLDSLRLITAKELFLETENFEKNLLLSQLNILRVISHLANQLKKKEGNTKRKDWLHQLAVRYENYYQRVYAMITIKT